MPASFIDRQRSDVARSTRGRTDVSRQLDRDGHRRGGRDPAQMRAGRCCPRRREDAPVGPQYPTAGIDEVQRAASADRAMRTGGPITAVSAAARHPQGRRNAQHQDPESHQVFCDHCDPLADAATRSGDSSTEGSDCAMLRTTAAGPGCSVFGRSAPTRCARQLVCLAHPSRSFPILLRCRKGNERSTMRRHPGFAPITLVLTVHNCASELPDLLTSIGRLRLLPSEVAITDLGSTDGTLELLRAWTPPYGIPVRVIVGAGSVDVRGPKSRDRGRLLRAHRRHARRGVPAPGVVGPDVGRAVRGE